MNDVALLYLAQPVQYADNVDAICLPDSPAVIDPNHCFASGWGKDTFGMYTIISYLLLMPKLKLSEILIFTSLWFEGKEGHYQVILKRVEMPLVPSDRCQDLLRTTRLGHYYKLDKSFICAGGEAGKDTCKVCFFYI